jgi:hypothetical protein
MEIRRCHHVKVNGTQCGSPALRGKCYCYFHINYRHLGAYGVKLRGHRNPFAGRFPVLEDANSIQAAVMQVIRLILAQQIDSKEAGLLLYALQIASSNLQRLRLEPLHYEVVVDPLLVGYSRIGGHPTREEQFKIETEEEQKERDELEHQIEQTQEQSDAEWEAETRREFEATGNPEAEEPQADSTARCDSATMREQINKAHDAGRAMCLHPGEPEYARAYEAAFNQIGKPAEEPAET